MLSYSPFLNGFVRIDPKGYFAGRFVWSTVTFSGAADLSESHSSEQRPSVSNWMDLVVRRRLAERARF